MPADDEVGYRKPPRHTRFRKGRSGNPKGRPKGAQNLKTDLLEELGERIPIRHQGRPSRITKQRALLKSQLARALQGNQSAVAQVVTLILRVLGPEAGAETPEPGLTAEEQEVLKLALVRIGSEDDEPEGEGGA